MAYTIYKQDAFSKGEGEVGWDYQTADYLLNIVLAISLGRYYMEAGNVVYESRHERTA